MPQPIEILLPRRRKKMCNERMRHAVQRRPLDDTRHAETVVAVKVREAQPVHRTDRHTGQHHLPLGALAGIEEDTLVVPAQQVAIVVAVAVGT